MDDLRFEDSHPALPIGTLCHTEFRGRTAPYVFVGWRSNTVGRMAVFAMVHQGEFSRDGWATLPYLLYTATNTETILRKFPDLPPAAPAA